MPEVIVNRAASTLTAPITNSSPSGTIADGTGMPSGGSSTFRVVIDPDTAPELCRVTRSGTTLTFQTRGEGGTTAQAHLAGAAVVVVASAEAITQVLLDAIAAHGADTGTHPSLAGQNGAPGSFIHSGASAPSNGLGIVGDLHINTTTWDVRQKTGPATWTVIGNIKGATGATGAAGTPGAAGGTGATGAGWVTGTGPPSAGTGANGDKYLNLTTGDVYGPKAAGAWAGIVGNLRGPGGPASDKTAVTTVSGTALTLEADDASVFDITLTADCTITLIPPSSADASSVTLILRQGGGGNWEVSFPANCTFPTNGTVPNLSNGTGKVDVLTCMWASGQWWIFESGLNFKPAAFTFPTLAVTLLGTVVSASVAANFASGSLRPTNGAGIIVAVASTRSTNDPTTPIVAGGGVTAFTQVGSPQIFDTGGATRRRLTCWAARQDVYGAAAPINIAYRTGNAPPVDVPHGGCLALILQVAGLPRIDLLESKGVGGSNGTGGSDPSASSAPLTFAAAAAAANRALVFVAQNGVATHTTDWDNGAGATSITGADITKGTLVTSLIALWKPSTFDTTFTDTLSTNVTHAQMGFELEQGV